MASETMAERIARRIKESGSSNDSQITVVKTESLKNSSKSGK